MRTRAALAAAALAAALAVPGAVAGAQQPSPPKPKPSSSSQPSTPRSPTPSSPSPAPSAPSRPAPPTTAALLPPPPGLAPGVPPPVNISALAGVDPTPRPLDNVKQSVECITGILGNSASSQIALRPWGQERLRIEQVWPFSRGAGQTVAVIDTGVFQHPRLAGRLLDGGDFVSTMNGFADCDGHGTIVAGIIAASQDPRTAFAGVAPDARILAVRQLSKDFKVETPGQNGLTPNGVGTVGTLASAIRHAADTPGVTVVNLSEAACTPPALAYGPGSAQLQAAVHYAVEKNIVVVAAAGNIDPSSNCKAQNAPGQINTVVSPAWYDDDVLTVSSVSRDGTPSEFDIHGPWVDIAAPGTEITSLDPTGPGLTNALIDNGRTQPIQGTSFATPYVAGVVALVRARYPTLSPVQVVQRIEQTAQHPAGAGGHNDLLGYGVVDPVAAVTDVLPAEQGLPARQPSTGRLDLSPAPPPDRTPRLVALVGTGSGLAVLGLTAFAVYTVRRARRLRAAAGGEVAERPRRLSV